MAAEPTAGIVTRLGIAQTLAWASSYYLPAMLAAPMARDLGVSTPTVFAAFSAALIISALLGPYAGHLIDRYGGRPVLAVISIIFAAGPAGLGRAPGRPGPLAGWRVLGLRVGSGLFGTGRKRGVWGKEVVGCGDLGRRPITQKKKKKKQP